MLRTILSDKNLTLYQLEKSSHISHATLNDIYNEKSNIDHCSISVVSKIANTLNMSIDTLYDYLSYKDLSLFKYDDDFDLFKSNTLQRLKRTDEISFINQLISETLIEDLYKQKEYSKSLYLLSLIDYLSIKNNVPLENKYAELRNAKLDRVYVPKSIFLLLATKIVKVSDIYKESIDTFLSHNIVEAEIYSVI